MTYQEAIEEAREKAKIIGVNQIVFQWEKHWWQKCRYGRCGEAAFNTVCHHHPIVKLLIITPDGTIAQ